MQILGKIKDEFDWLKFAPPEKGEEQWKDGRSAKELAKFFTQHEGEKLPRKIADILKKYDIFDDDFCCYPEHETKFDECGGKGRQHDLLMVHKDIVVGIEAKADEPLGDTVEITVKNALKNTSKSRVPERADGLAKNIFGYNSWDEIKDFRYQLLTATAGLLQEAVNREINRALLLIITFMKKGVDSKNKPFFDPQKIKLNENDIEKYKNALSDRFAGQPCIFTYKNQRIEFFIEHINIEIDYSEVYL